MRKLILISTLIGAFVFSSCGGGSKRAAKPSPEVKKPANRVSRVSTYEDEGGIPKWFYNPPKRSGAYFFAGVGKGKSKGAAKNAALADVFSQVIYMINASITSNSSFESYVEENEKDARRNSSVFKKVRAKGGATLENFEVESQHVTKETTNGKTRNVFYILAKVPKSEIAAARKRLAKEREEKRKNTMGVFAVAVYPNGSVQEIDTIKSTIENLYKSMGYNIKSVDVSFNKAAFRSSGRLVSFLKSNAYPDIKKALVCVIKPSGVRREKMGNMQVTGILGDMTIREVNLVTGEVKSANTFSGKGVSLRKDSSKVEDAFRKLIKSLTDELLSDPTGSGKDEDEY